MVGKATTGSSFSGLAKYLTKDLDRIAWTDTRGLVGADPKEIAREMRAAADQSDRVEKPVYHLSLSFSAADAPTPEAMRVAGEHVLAELGLKEHQALLVAHRDKEHPHLHIMVNRVHPVTGKAWQGSHDYQQIERALRTLEKDWKLTPTPGHHARNAGDPTPDRSQTHATGEIRRARRTGELPFPEQIRRDVGAAFREAKSWEELNRRLGTCGYRIEPTARGMTITDGERHAKASGVDPEGSRFRLEKRFAERLDDYLQRGHGAVRQITSAPEKPDIYHEVFGAPALGRTGVALPTAIAKDLHDQVFGPPMLTPAMIEAARASRAAASVDKSPAQIAASPASHACEVDAGRSTGMGSMRAVGFLAAAARPVSREDAEKEMVLRSVEVGLRASAALAKGRSTQEVGEKHKTLTKDHPAVRALVRDAEAYRETERKEVALEKAIGEYTILEGKLKGAAEFEKRARAHEKAFDEHLARTYLNPGAAKTAFLRVSNDRGLTEAARRMHTEPERFGEVRTTIRTKWMGLATETNKGPAFRAAHSAAHHGEQYVQTLSRLPCAADQATWRKVLATTDRKIERLQQSLSGPLHKDRLLHRIAEHASSLSPDQLNRAQHLFSPGAFRLIRQAAQRTLDVARGGRGG